MRMQSFNRYRERFGEAPYKSFEELVGEGWLLNFLAFQKRVIAVGRAFLSSKVN